MVNVYKTLFKSAQQHLYHIHWSLARKKCLILTCEILGLLVNTLATDEKNPVLNRHNFTILTQMQFSRKEKHFFQFFAEFWKCPLNFEHFEKKRGTSQLLCFRNYGLSKRG